MSGEVVFLVAGPQDFGQPQFCNQNYPMVRCYKYQALKKEKQRQALGARLGFSINIHLSTVQLFLIHRRQISTNMSKN